MRAALAILAVSMYACSDPAGAPVDRDAAGPLESSFDSETIALSGELYAFQPDTDSEVRPPSARVCQDAPRRCTESHADGRWMLDGLAPARETVLTLESPGYVTVLFALVTPMFSSDIGLIGMVPLELSDTIGEDINALHAEAGLPELESKTYRGSLSFSAILGDGGFALDRSIQVRLEPEAGSEPAYNLSSGGWALEIPEGETVGFASILNLPPRDDYALVFSMEGGECSYSPSHVSGWPAQDGRTNVMRVPVRADATTYARALRCVRADAPPPQHDF